MIKASAGSGKTYSLARTYIVNLLGVRGEDGKYHLRNKAEYHRHILAITFTNKATEEMKQRIIKQLHLLSLGKGDYVGFFVDNFSDPLEEVRKAASRALGEILFNYDSFSVSTIDSFFQVILRTFAREIDFDNGYEIELDSSLALATAVNDILLDISTGRIGQKHRVFGWIKDYVRYLVDTKNNWNFFGNPQDLVKFSENINKEFFSDCSAQLEEYFSDMSGEVDRNNDSRIERFYKAVAKKVAILNKTVEGDTYRNRLMAIESDPSNFYGSRLFDRIANGKQATMDSLKKASTGDIKSLFKGGCYQQYSQDTIDRFVSWAKDYLRDMLQLEVLNSLLGNIWQLGLLSAIDHKLHDNLRQSNTLLLSDTGSLISKVVESSNTPDNSSFIYERVGTRYHNYMIDEFQDTSRMQYRNFDPLLRDGLANGNDMLIIGDEKQAIYRFRNSDPSMLREELKQDYNGFYDDTTLDDNFRSFAAVVNFNNVFFKYVPPRWFPGFKTLALTYKNVYQNVIHKEREGYVRINLIENTEDSLPLLPECINELLERDYNYGDIMVLVKTNAQGNKVVSELLNSGISVVSDESLLLASSPAVRMVINVLRFIESTLYNVPENDDEKVAAKSLKRVIREQRRYKLLHDFGKAFIADGGSTDGGIILQNVLEDNRKMAMSSAEEKIAALAQETMATLPDQATQPLHLVNVVDKVIERYLANADGECDSVATTFLSALQDDVIAFAGARNGGSVREYLRHWDKNADKLSLPAAATDAVQVMTIHKAKGLEKPVVLMPYLSWNMASFKTSKDGETLWIDKQTWLNAKVEGKPYVDIDDESVPPLIPILSSKLKDKPEFADFYNSELEKTLIDNFNNTYVAFTRPRQELHMWLVKPGDKSNKQSESTVGGTLNAFIGDLLANEVSIKIPGNKTFVPEFKVLEDENAIVFGKKESKYVRQEKSDEYAVKESERRALPLYRVTPLAAPVRVRVDDNRFSHFGNELHAVMSLVECERDLDYAESVLSDRFPADSDDFQRAKEVFSTVCDTIAGNPLVGSWFAPENTVYVERQISGRVEGLERTYSSNNRVDRFVVTPSGEAVVIDYKFGGDYTHETVNDYMAKVRDYMRLLRAAGYDNVKGYLWIVRDRNNPVREVKLL